MDEGICEKKIKEGDSGLYGLQKCSKIHHLSHGLEESQPRPDMLINQSDVVMTMLVYNVNVYTSYLY